MVDDDDYALCSKYKWHMGTSGHIQFSTHDSEHKTFMWQIHRIIMRDKLCGDLQVDHIDGDKLNNQKSNLRVCTARENCMNGKKQKYATSKYKGVYYVPGMRNWAAQIVVHRKRIYLGRYATEEEAALVYNKSAVEHFGEFSCVNKL